MENKLPELEISDEEYHRYKRHCLAIKFGVVNMLNEDWTGDEFEAAVKRRNEIIYGK